MRSVLVSIKPEFINQIKLGVKDFEFRKVIFKDVDRMYLYSSSPIQRVVAVCKISKILCASPDEVWNLTSNKSGISKTFFDLYFKGRTKAYAIEMKEIEFFNQPKLLSDFGVLRAPQSYQYIENE